MLSYSVSKHKTHRQFIIFVRQYSNNHMRNWNALCIERTAITNQNCSSEPLTKLAFIPPPPPPPLPKKNLQVALNYKHMLLIYRKLSSGGLIVHLGCSQLRGISDRSRSSVFQTFGEFKITLARLFPILWMCRAPAQVHLAKSLWWIIPGNCLTQENT